MQYNIEENSILFFTYCDFHPLILEKHDTDSNGFFFFFHSCDLFKENQ
jgi:hypothetical protein